MQETSCQVSNLEDCEIRELIALVMGQGDVNALDMLMHKINNSPEIEFSDLDMLSLFYLYCVWMNDESRENFNDISIILHKNLSTIWSCLLDDPTFLDIKDDYSDIMKELLLSLIKDIIYKYFNGLLGEEREKKPIYGLLLKLSNSNYSTIPDTWLKILFFGYQRYGRELFFNDAEFDLFQSFILRKSYIPFMDPESAQKQNEFDKELDLLNLV